MCRTYIGVNVDAIRLIVANIDICAKRIEHKLCNIPRTTIHTAQTNLYHSNKSKHPKKSDNPCSSCGLPRSPHFIRYVYDVQKATPTSLDQTHGDYH